MKKRIVFVLLILSLLSSILSFSGCTSHEPTVSLSDSDKAIISNICENVDKWNNPIYDSGSNHDINRIGIGKDSTGSLILETGWMEIIQTNSQITSAILKTQAYDIDNGFQMVNASSGYNCNPGFSVDVKAMSKSELYSAVEKAYISFLKKG